MSTNSRGDCCGQLRMECPPQAELQFCPQRWGLTAERESKQKMRGTRRADSLEKTLMLGKIKGRRRKGWQRMRRLDGIFESMDMSLSNKLFCQLDKSPWQLFCPGNIEGREAWHAAVHGVAKSWTWLNDWTRSSTQTQRKRKVVFRMEKYAAQRKQNKALHCFPTHSQQNLTSH